MGPKLFERSILPGIVKQAETIHAKGAYFIKHTDGNTWKIMEMLIEAGIDGWHGIQPSIGMDMGRLKENYGDKICFFGGVNCETLIAGSPDDVRMEVRAAIDQAAPGGGLVVTSGNVLQPGVVLENYMAGLKMVKKYGKYPIGDIF
jgi:uroporphyrinogen decarboxylase